MKRLCGDRQSPQSKNGADVMSVCHVAETGKATVVAAAKHYRSLGYAIAFLAPGEKRPTHKRWTRHSQEPGDYVDGANLGILTGRLSDDLVCVDLDSEESIAKAESFLPATSMIDGRKS